MKKYIFPVITTFVLFLFLVPVNTVHAMDVPQIRAIYDEASGGFIVENAQRYVENCPTQLKGNYKLNGNVIDSFCFGCEYYNYIDEENGAVLFRTEHLGNCFTEPGTVTFSVTYSVISNNAEAGKTTASASFVSDGSGNGTHAPINTNSQAVETYKKRDDLAKKGLEEITQSLATEEGLAGFSELADIFEHTCGVDVTLTVDTALSKFFNEDALTVIGASLNAAPSKDAYQNTAVEFSLSQINANSVAAPEGYEVIAAMVPAISIDGEELTEYVIPIYVTMPFFNDCDPTDFYLYKDNGSFEEVDFVTTDDNAFSFIITEPANLIFVKAATIIEEPAETTEDVAVEDIEDSVEETDLGNTTNVLVILVIVVILVIAVVVTILMKKRSHT